MEHSLKTHDLRAEDMGSLRNRLGILSPDRKRINSATLLKVTGLGPAKIEKLTGIARPQLYRTEVPLKLSSKLMKHIIAVVIVTDLAYDLFGNNEKETVTWLMSPNSTLFGDSPFEVCMRGDGSKLIQWLSERLGKEAGAAL